MARLTLQTPEPRPLGVRCVHEHVYASFIHAPETLSSGWLTIISMVRLCASVFISSFMLVFPECANVLLQCVQNAAFSLSSIL